MRTWRAVLAAAVAACLCSASPAASLRSCSGSPELTPLQHDRLLQFSAWIRADLAQQGARLALVARSGSNLGRFDIRYSHAGLSLRDSEQGPWAVRQLYFACDEGRPRLFDEGLTAFLAGSHEVDRGFVSVLLLPEAAALALEAAARDRDRALALLEGDYQANAHPYSLGSQNCNQWLAELLAEAWAPATGEPAGRARSQAWLRAKGYAPRPIQLSTDLWFVAAAWVPWLSLRDHPPSDRAALRMVTTLPEHLDTLVQQREPQVRRIEWCHVQGRVVRREGWGRPLDEACTAEAGDQRFDAHAGE